MIRVYFSKLTSPTDSKWTRTQQRRREGADRVFYVGPGGTAEVAFCGDVDCASCAENCATAAEHVARRKR